MRAYRVPLALAALAVLAIAGVLILRHRNAPAQHGASGMNSVQTGQVFTVQGRVVSLDADSGIVKIAHEEIPGYMPAMTMPFMARDSNSLRKLKPGDQVTFLLSVNDRDAWISGITRTGSGKETAVVESDEARQEHLRSGEIVPGFTFVDQDAKPRSSAEFAGKYVVVTFIYTRCPLPNLCPLLSRKFAELQGRLSREYPGKFHLISVTIDPAYDAPAVLKGYARMHNADEASWTFATGSAEEISTIAGLFGLTFSQKNPGLIDHDMRTALIGPDGRLTHVWKSNFWTPYEIRNRIEEQQSRQAALAP